MRTAFTPVFDVDILHEHAAQLVEEVVRNYLQERGTTLVRIGLPPKRAIIMRTNVPFKKIIAHAVESQLPTLLTLKSKFSAMGNRQWSA